MGCFLLPGGMTCVFTDKKLGDGESVKTNPAWVRCRRTKQLLCHRFPWKRYCSKDYHPRIHGTRSTACSEIYRLWPSCYSILILIHDTYMVPIEPIQHSTAAVDRVRCRNILLDWVVRAKCGRAQPRRTELLPQKWWADAPNSLRNRRIGVLTATERDKAFIQRV